MYVNSTLNIIFTLDTGSVCPLILLTLDTSMSSLPEPEGQQRRSAGRRLQDETRWLWFAIPLFLSSCGSQSS